MTAQTDDSRTPAQTDDGIPASETPLGALTPAQVYNKREERCPTMVVAAADFDALVVRHRDELERLRGDLRSHQLALESSSGELVSYKLALKIAYDQNRELRKRLNAMEEGFDHGKGGEDCDHGKGEVEGYRPTDGCDHDYDNPRRLGRANYECRKCGTNISMDMVLLAEADEDMESGE